MTDYISMARGGSCSRTTIATESYEEPTVGASSSFQLEWDSEQPRKRRRHSSYQSRPWSLDYEMLPLALDGFLNDLGRRLEMLETYGQLTLEGGVKSVHDTLRTVHSRCMHVGDDIIDAGRRRRKVLVETMETHFRDALVRRDTLEQKVQEGVKMLESNLVALEEKAYNMRQAGHEMFDNSKVYMDNASSKATEMMLEGADAARRAKASMKLKVELAIAQARNHGLITYEMLPEPWRCNPHIVGGYRFSETTMECIRSCFTLSNEFFNIWSHAIGLAIVLALAFYVYPTTPAFSSASYFDIFVAGCFFFAACECLVCSILWHAMSSISNQKVMERFACVDYTGISLLVAASIMTTEYTAFYCEPWSRWIYLITTLMLGVAGTILPWHPTFNRPDMSWVRVVFFVSLATTGFFPIVQLTLQRGMEEALYFYAPITKSILVYLGGALMYAGKIPERFLPGWFDYAGGSHNIWHVCVLGGILFHYHAMVAFFGEAFRRAEIGCSSY